MTIPKQKQKDQESEGMFSRDGNFKFTRFTVPQSTEIMQLQITDEPKGSLATLALLPPKLEKNEHPKSDMVYNIVLNSLTESTSLTLQPIRIFSKEELKVLPFESIKNPDPIEVDAPSVVTGCIAAIHRAASDNILDKTEQKAIANLASQINKALSDGQLKECEIVEINAASSLIAPLPTVGAAKKTQLSIKY